MSAELERERQTDDSPKINPDLLQRSEVVALFNTLHRVTESLAAVDEFRKMYAETQATAAESVKQKREWVSGRRASGRQARLPTG